MEKKEKWKKNDENLKKTWFCLDLQSLVWSTKTIFQHFSELFKNVCCFKSCHRLKLFKKSVYFFKALSKAFISHSSSSISQIMKRFSLVNSYLTSSHQYKRLQVGPVTPRLILQKRIKENNLWVNQNISFAKQHSLHPTCFCLFTCEKSAHQQKLNAVSRKDCQPPQKRGQA